MKHSQTSIEFIILVGFVLFFLTLFLIAVQENTSYKTHQRKNQQVKELILGIQDEINLASEASEGYYREFNVPNQVAGMDYQVGIAEDFLYIKTTDGRFAISLPVPSVVGDILKGDNFIKKENGAVYLNQ